MTEVEKAHQASLGLKGGLGAAVWTVLEGLRRADVPRENIDATFLLLKEAFARLSNEDCNLLCSVLSSRLKEDEHAPGVWY